jgi:hypothetical protein
MAAIASDAFADMTGITQITEAVAITKYIGLRARMKTFVTMLNTLVELMGKSLAENPCWEAMQGFIARRINPIPWVEDDEDPQVLGSRSRECAKAMAEHYVAMKEHHVVLHCMLILERMKPYEKSLARGVGGVYDYVFIMDAPGIALAPFQFAEKFNLKELWGDDRVTEPVRNTIMRIIDVIYHRVVLPTYEMIMTPDRDRDEAVGAIMASVESLRIKPKFGRVGGAFRVLENSVGMLRDNYNSYYADSVRAKNSGIILEHFIRDVTERKPLTKSEKREFALLARMAGKGVANRTKNQNTKALVGHLMGIAEKSFEDKDDA